MRSLAALLVGLALGLPACATGAADTEPVDEDVAPIMRRELHVVDGRPGIDFDVTADAIAAPRTSVADLGSRTAGDVIVSKSGAGFLRRVRGIRTEGDRVVVDTEPAALEDAFVQARVRGSVGENASLPPVAGGLAPRAVTLALPAFSLHDRRLDLGGGNEIEIVDADLGITPQLDFDLLVRSGTVEKLKVVAGGEAHAHAHLRYHLKKPGVAGTKPFFHPSGDAGLMIGQTPSYSAIFWAGWVPVVVSVRAKLLADWRIVVGAELEGEQDVGADGSVSLGLAYQNGGFRNLSARSLSVRGHGDHSLVSHALEGELTLTARLEISFYEVNGPFVGLQAYAGVREETSASGTNWFAVEGVRGTAGAQVGVFGKSIVGYETVLFDASTHTPL